MPSSKASYIVEMMRKVKRMPKQEGAVDYAKRRAFVEARHAQQPTAPGVTFQEMELDGVAVVCAIPERQKGTGAALYIHGGGFVTGSANTSKGYASFLAKESGLRVYSVSYRLAPEHPAPAASDDCFSVYKAILSMHPGEKVALVGGSAGGNLCMVTALRAKEEKITLPSAIALFSPVTEQTGHLPSRRVNAQRDCTISGEIDQEIEHNYFPGQDPLQSMISPLYGDLHGLPPILIVADESEVLLDDSVLLAAYAKNAGADVELQITQGLFHDFPSVGPELPEATQVMADTVSLLRRCGM